VQAARRIERRVVKTKYVTCAPAGRVTLTGSDADAARADGCLEPFRWCNAHIAILGGKPCRKAEIVVDDEHPMYGTLGTVCYPQDRYPVVVVGGSSTGSHLFVAPLRTDGLEPAGTSGPFPVFDRRFTVEEALERAIPARAFRINRKRNGTYSDYVRLGYASYHRDYSY
jgi:hypothetical protein